MPDSRGKAYSNVKLFEELIALSVELHNLNAIVQRHYTISIVQWLVLKKIFLEPGLSAGTLAAISGVQPSTLTSTINRLESMGLIYIQERASDLRRKFIICSKNGMECCRENEQGFAEAFSAIGIESTHVNSIGKIRSLTKHLISSFGVEPKF